jgi:hypothetical protein
MVDAGLDRLPTHIYGDMLSCMKTTVDLPDDLLIKAKKRAAEQRRPLRSILVDGLRAQLQTSTPPTRRKRKLRWVTSKGGLPPVDVSSREAMHDWLQRQP